MSASSPDPSWQLPLPPDAGPERRRVKPVHLLVGSLLALALLCCGGAAAVEVFTSGKPGKTAAAGPASSGPAQAPTDGPTTPAVQPAVATSATPAATASKSPKPRPTTHKPTTEPATRPPTRTPPPTPTTTVPSTLPVVRAGSFCEPVGAFGITARGKLMRCVQTSEDERPRWRAV